VLEKDEICARKLKVIYIKDSKFRGRVWGKINKIK